MTAPDASISRRPLTIGLHLDGDGGHPAAWRFANHAPHDLLTGRRVAETVLAAETAGFGFVSFGGGHLPPDSYPNITARIDSVQQAAFAGPLTTRIGLVPEAEALFVEPFHTSNQLSSVDHVSRGRAGWIVKASNSSADAATYGRDPINDPVALRQEVHDVIEVSRLLWDSWEQDAVIRDTTTWRYIDREKLHYVDFEGVAFSIKGPSYVPAPPQSQLPIFADAGLVDPHAVDVTIVHAPTLPELIDAARRARIDGAQLVQADIEAVLDSKGIVGGRRLQIADDFTQWAPCGNLRVVGQPDELTQVIEALAGSVDIVRIIPGVIDVDLPELRFVVLPELFRAGIALAPGIHTTLRETLGLVPAANRHVAAR